MIYQHSMILHDINKQKLSINHMETNNTVIDHGYFAVTGF